MSGTKNLGQVAGLFIGASAPSNTTLIWFDSTPAIQCHKVYNNALGQWVVLDNSVISPITYSEIVTLATGNGLTIGQWFKITDRGNVLALAITTTKIQYTDALANIVIDDLGHNKSYIVSSSNLLIDDLSGVWDSVDNKLVFSFDEATPSMNDNYYILGKGKINNVWKFVKFKITKLLSTENGNAISWINGLYLNFTEKLKTYYNKPGGVVSKDSYDADQSNIQNQINNAANNIQNVAQLSKQNINDAVTDVNIYSKQLPVDPVQQTAVDIIKNDTLQTIVLKINNFIQRFKYATGVWISKNYSEIPTVGSSSSIQIVNNNDSVETAIAKLSGHVRALQRGADKGTDNVILSPDYSEQTHTLVPGVTNLTDVIEQLAFKISRNIQPIHSIVAYNVTPTYEHIMADAGYGWFPCGVIMSGTQEQCEEEKKKWTDYYSETLNFDITNISGSNYYLILNSVVINGVTNDVPNITGKVFRGFDPRDRLKYIGKTGGSDTHVITIGEIPSHNHGGYTGNNGSHNHYGKTGTNSHVHLMREDYGCLIYPLSSEWKNVGILETGSLQLPKGITYTANPLQSNVHDHPISVEPDHNHTITSQGGGTAMNITNPMVLTSFIIRLL